METIDTATAKCLQNRCCRASRNRSTGCQETNKTTSLQQSVAARRGAPDMDNALQSRASDPSLPVRVRAPLASVFPTRSRATNGSRCRAKSSHALKQEGTVHKTVRLLLALPLLLLPPPLLCCCRRRCYYRCCCCCCYCCRNCVASDAAAAVAVAATAAGKTGHASNRSCHPRHG